jgi:hypothetical protein
VSMTGYVSQIQSGDGWAIVRVEPGHWIATLPIHELRRLLNDKAQDVNLMGITYHWADDQLVLHLGPARVTGPVAAWRHLVRQLTDNAVSAAGLYEAPRARPWEGPVSDVGVTSVEVDGSPIHPAYQPQPSPVVDELAHAGDFAPREFVELFGAEWHLPAGPVRHEQPVTYVIGDPWQLAAVISADGLSLGKPRAQWDGVAQKVLDVAEQVPVDGSMPIADLRQIAQRLLRSRRRSFTWCRYCARQIPPEDRYSQNICHGCASIWYGVVY